MQHLHTREMEHRTKFFKVIEKQKPVYVLGVYSD